MQFLRCLCQEALKEALIEDGKESLARDAGDSFADCIMALAVNDAAKEEEKMR